MFQIGKDLPLVPEELRAAAREHRAIHQLDRDPFLVGIVRSDSAIDGAHSSVCDLCFDPVRSDAPAYERVSDSEGSNFESIDEVGTVEIDRGSCFVSLK